MSIELFEKESLFEHRFWLQVLGDHARFIFDALSPKEVTEVQKARYFIDVFDRLLEEARKPLSDTQLFSLTQQAYQCSQEIREFKLFLIRQHLIGDITIELPPTFINHMVNEVEEYLTNLQCLLLNKVPRNHPVHHHLIWLLDAAGHASALSGAFDMVEKKLIKQSDEFMKAFEQFFIKAAEIKGYMRTGLTRFPALERFNHQVEKEIICFTKFLEEIREMEEDKKILSTLTPLMPDHMAREECYYLTKLAQSSEVKLPDCDPTRPRPEG